MVVAVLALPLFVVQSPKAVPVIPPLKPSLNPNKKAPSGAFFHIKNP
jgi:hypothetical protein